HDRLTRRDAQAKPCSDPAASPAGSLRPERDGIGDTITIALWILSAHNSVVNPHRHKFVPESPHRGQVGCRRAAAPYAAGVMIFRTSRVRAQAAKARARVLAAGFLLAWSLPALPWPTLAQSAPAGDEDQDAPAESSAPSVNDEDVLRDIDISKLDWSQLAVDASTLGDGPAVKATTPRPSADGGMTWSNRNQATGSPA